uniref:Succinate dehydrogenase subunit 8A, mitochondrial n=1 Tax=Oryza glaberrima TaxID=4538 RepID=I1PZ38_ORYGL
MIYRKWSLLSSTILIWGGAATAGLAGVFLFNAKEKFQKYLSGGGQRLRQQDRAAMGKN